MHPILFEIGGLKVETYGVLGVLAYGLMLLFIARQGKRAGFDERRLAWTVGWATIGTLIGGRLTYILVNWDFIAQDPGRAYRFWEGGLVSTGGLLGMNLGAAGYALVSRMPLGKVLDLAALSGALCLAISRWGCFFAGCDYGCPASDLPWSVTFTEHTSLVPEHLLGVPLHPAQIYMSLANLAVFVTGYALFRLRTRPGLVFGACAVLYSALRFAIETIRGDEDRGLFFSGSLSTSQLVVIFWFVVGVLGLVFAGRGPMMRGDTLETGGDQKRY